LIIKEVVFSFIISKNKDEKTSKGFDELGENFPTCSDFLSFVSWLNWICSLANFNKIYAFWQ